MRVRLADLREAGGLPTPNSKKRLRICKRAAVGIDLRFWRRGTRKARTEADSSSILPEVGACLPGQLPPGFYSGWKAPGAAYHHQRATGISPQLPIIAKKALLRATLRDSGCKKAQGSATCGHHATKCPTLVLASIQLASIVPSRGIHFF